MPVRGEHIAHVGGGASPLGAPMTRPDVLYASRSGARMLLRLWKRELPSSEGLGGSRRHDYSCATDEETEAWRGHRTCPRPTPHLGRHAHLTRVACESLCSRTRIRALVLGGPWYRRWRVPRRVGFPTQEPRVWGHPACLCRVCGGTGGPRRACSGRESDRAVWTQPP